MSWAKMAQPVTADANGSLLTTLKADLNRRVQMLPESLLNEPTADPALTWLYHGWQVHEFPDYPSAVTARTEHGWAYLPSKLAFGLPPEIWRSRTPGHREACIAQTLTAGHMFVFLTLGGYASSVLLQPAERLRSGIWALLAAHLPADEFEATTFLYRLGGTVSFSGHLFDPAGPAGPLREAAPLDAPLDDFIDA